MYKILMLAILLRLLIMPFYFHPDIKTTYFQTSFLRQGVLDIYKYLDTNNHSIPFKEDFTYFPLTYFFLGGYQILVSPILGPNFYNWLNDASAYAPTQISVFKYLFVLKIPYLILDIMIAFLLMRFFTNPQDKKKIFIFWLFNPIWLLLIYVYSNLDIIPVFITLVSFLLLSKNKLFLSSLLIGVAAGFKAYPLMFLPFMALYAKNLKQVGIIFFSGLLTFILIIAPFWSISFKNQALISGLTTRIFQSSVSIGFGESLVFAIISFSALFFYLLVNKERTWENTYKAILLELLFLFSFIHFHITWLLWLAPLLTLFLIYVKSLQKILLPVLSIAFLIPLFYQDQALSFGLLKVISPLYNLLPMPFTITQYFYDPYIVQSTLQSILAGGSLILAWNLFKERQT